mgnify:CR=1 FL=1
MVSAPFVVYVAIFLVADDHTAQPESARGLISLGTTMPQHAFPDPLGLPHPLLQEASRPLPVPGSGTLAEG